MTDRIRAELKIKFIGHARVLLSELVYTSAREENRGSVARLSSIFGSDCDRANLGHSVPVIIDPEVLQQALGNSELAALPDHGTHLLKLPIGVKLRCLHGLQRLLAAEQTLPLHDQWWPVALYASSLSDGAKCMLAEQSDSAQEYSDGDIFLHYRGYLDLGDPIGVARWRQRLTISKSENLQQLERSLDGTLIRSLDRLCPYKGLWSDFSLGAFNNILPTRCYEEIQSYFDLMLRMWQFICGTDVPPGDLDQDTVRALELLCPIASLEDSEYIMSLERLDFVFSTVRDGQVREKIFMRILQCPRVLSMASFHGDVMYLAAGQRALKQLFCFDNTKVQVTTPAPHCKRKTGRRTRVRRHATFRLMLKWHFTSESQYFDCNYLDLWMHALRFYHRLSSNIGNRPPIDELAAVDQVAYVDVQRREEIAMRAWSLGFRTEELRNILNRAKRVVQLETAGMTRTDFSTDRCDARTVRRCNRPADKTLETDRTHLYPEPLHDNWQVEKRQFVTSIFVLYDIVQCFFGRHAPENLLNPARYTSNQPSFSEVNETSPSSDQAGPPGFSELRRSHLTTPHSNMKHNAVFVSDIDVDLSSHWNRDTEQDTDEDVSIYSRNVDEGFSNTRNRPGTMMPPAIPDSSDRAGDRNHYAKAMREDDLDDDLDELTGGRAKRDEEDRQRTRREELENDAQVFTQKTSTPSDHIARGNRLKKRHVNRGTSIINGRVQKTAAQGRRRSHADVAKKLREKGARLKQPVAFPAT